MTECRLCDKVLQRASKALEDTVLLENAHFVCIPALGALLPGYVIVVSKRHVTSINRLTEIEIDSLTSILHQLMGFEIYQDGHLLFEHGTQNSLRGGACIYHYHLHFLPIQNMTISNIEERIPISTTRHMVENIFSVRSNKTEQSYLLLSDGITTVCHMSDEIPSQLVRRIVAEYIGMPEQWNWTIYPHMDRVVQTIDAVRMG